MNAVPTITTVEKQALVFLVNTFMIVAHTKQMLRQTVASLLV